MIEFDYGTILTCLGTGAAVVGLIYTFLRNFMIDINSHIDRLEKRMDKFEVHMNLLEERMFWLATGKKLEDAILEERLKEARK